MIQAGIKEVKNNPSRFLNRVKAGEEVMITERGKPVARIIKENSLCWPSELLWHRWLKRVWW